jgi:hypothetical protein
MAAKMAICCGNSVTCKVGGYVEWSMTILPMFGIRIAKIRYASSGAKTTLTHPILVFVFSMRVMWPNEKS